jgi:hypothetical protein
VWLAVLIAAVSPVASAAAEVQQPEQVADQAPGSDDLWQRKMLFGDLGGLRPWLDGYGIKLGITETS